MRCICWNQVYLVVFLLEKEIFHIQNTIFLFLLLRLTGRHLADSITVDKTVVFEFRGDGQLGDDIIVIEDDLFTFFDGVLSIEAEAESFEYIFIVDTRV